MARNTLDRRTENRLHVRMDGRSWNFSLANLDLGTLSTDNEIRQALARYLGLQAAQLAAYVVERLDNGSLTVRPESVFG